MAYHPYTGDYGPNFLGHALNTAIYLRRDNEFGWICFGGNVEEHRGSFRPQHWIEYNPTNHSLSSATENVAIA
jgi:hypothetical protein